MSLHRHIQASYKFDNFSRSFMDILAAQQTPAGSQWYQGTADAVRQNMRYFLERPFDYYLILSGDQLYRMDFRALLHQHIEIGADITLATKPVARSQVSEFGIMQSGVDRRITRFVEKPTDESVLQEMKMSRELLGAIGSKEEEELFQASMGIYVFNRDVLIRMLGRTICSISGNILSRHRSKTGMSARLFSRAIGRTSEQSALFTKRISIYRCRARIQFLRARVSDLHASALFAGKQNQRRHPAAGDYFGWMHHLGCASGTMCSGDTQRYPKRRDHPEQHPHGRGLF